MRTGLPWSRSAGCSSDVPLAVGDPLRGRPKLIAPAFNAADTSQNLAKISVYAACTRLAAIGSRTSRKAAVLGNAACQISHSYFLSGLRASVGTLDRWGIS